MSKWKRYALATAGAAVLIFAIGPIVPQSAIGQDVIDIGRTKPSFRGPACPCPANTAFQFDLIVNLSDGQIGSGASFTVPPHGRLVIEHVSALVLRVPPGLPDDIERVDVTTEVNGTVVFHRLDPGVARDVGPGFSARNISQPVRWYADPGTTVTADIQRTMLNSATGGVQGFFTFSGHFE